MANKLSLTKAKMGLFKRSKFSKSEDQSRCMALFFSLFPFQSPQLCSTLEKNEQKYYNDLHFYGSTHVIFINFCLIKRATRLDSKKRNMKKYIERNLKVD